MTVTKNRRRFGRRPIGPHNERETTMPGKTEPTEAEAVKIWQKMAAELGGVPPEVQKMANVNAKGTPRAGGLSEYGHAAAANMPMIMETARNQFEKMINDEVFAPGGDGAASGGDGTATEGKANGLLRDMLGIVGKERTATNVAAARALQGWPALVVGLGLGAPIRVALRAAAQAFAVALDDGATDDAGAVRGKVGGVHDDRMHIDSEGHTIVEPVLGHQPFTVLRYGLMEVDGETVPAVSVSPGGAGLGPDEDDSALIDLGSLLMMALRGVTAARERGVDVNSSQMIVGVRVPGTDGPQAGSGNGPNTEDPYGNRGDTPAESPPAEGPPGDDRGVPASSGEAPAGGGEPGDAAPDGGE